MPSRIIHYCIGNEILKLVRLDSNLFTLGNLSPDAHDGSPLGVATSHYKTVYRVGIDKYPSVDLESFRSKYLSNFFDDFIIGYYCHLITDNIWSASVYYGYLECDEDERNARIAKCYNDYGVLNKILIDHFKLSKVTLEVPSYISVDEITIENLTRVTEVLCRDFDRTYSNGELTILSLGFVFNFIKRATEECLKEIVKHR